MARTLLGFAPQAMARHPLVVGIGIVAVVCLAVLFPRELGGLQFLELAAHDRMLAMRHAGAPPHRAMGIVGVSEADIRRFGYPIPDGVLARALQSLLDGGAALVGVDLYRDLPVEPGHQALQSLLAETDRVVWIFGFGNHGREAVPPPPALAKTDRVGFNDLPVDPDGVVRRGLLYQDDGQRVYAAFPLQMALALLREQNVVPRPWEEDPTVLQLGESPLPPLTANHGGYQGLAVGGYQFLLDYQVAASGLPVLSVGELLDGAPPGWIRDRVVLIGTMARSVNDSALTPFPLGQGEDPQLRGVLLQAMIVDQLLRLANGETRLMGDWSAHRERLWIGLWSALGVVLSFLLGSFLRILLVGLGGLLVMWGLVYGLFLQQLWVPVVPPALAWVLALSLGTAYQVTVERAQRARLMMIFARHVSPEVASLLWAQRETLLHGGRVLPRRVTATVLFTDLVGFTSIAEGSDPPQLMEWLNRYMATMSREVFCRDGVIDKYIGDAIMAVFGVPLGGDDEETVARHATNAVDAALAMGEALAELNTTWAQEGLSQVGMRIGIHTGALVAGSLGGDEHVEYTVIGDTVNTASRLESFDKALPAPTGMWARILIGEATYRRVAEYFLVESVGQVALKGKDQHVKVYRVLGRRGASDPVDVAC